ncbi:MAG TPA: hypothetical protein VG246_10595 [Acidimicrobiales bacterium]|nr:hypothetical protein [Acidimicrobiales bacterium]
MRGRPFIALLAVVLAAMTPFVGDVLHAGAASKVAPFDPISVSFSSPERGWALGTLACAHQHRCLTLLETANSGQSWFEVQLPVPLVTDIDRFGNDKPGFIGGIDVHFANSTDGWIYGQEPATIHQGSQSYRGFKSVLWATHDGGTLWLRQALPGMNPQGNVYDVESTRTTVYVLAPTRSNTAEVESSSVDANKWQQASGVALNGEAGGGQPSGAMVIDGSTGWLIFGNDRGATGSAQLSKRGAWVAWRSPCAAVGHGYAVPAAANARDLVAVCGMGGFAYGMPKSAPRGAAIGSSWLYFSTNGGVSFKAGTEIRPVKGNLSFGQFAGVLASPRPGAVILGRNVGDGADLIASYDDGARWGVVYRGQVSYLDFVDPNVGVGLVRLANNEQRMIMTSDGGRRWRAMTF